MPPDHCDAWVVGRDVFGWVLGTFAWPHVKACTAQRGSGKGTWHACIICMLHFTYKRGIKVHFRGACAVEGAGTANLVIRAFEQDALMGERCPVEVCAGPGRCRLRFRFRRNAGHALVGKLLFVQQGACWADDHGGRKQQRGLEESHLHDQSKHAVRWHERER
jgi:hypothetical protein